MEEQPPSKAMWVLALPLVPIQIFAIGLGAGVGAMVNGPVVLDALCTWVLVGVLSTALMAPRAGWGQAAAIVGMASVLAMVGVTALLALGAALLFGLLVAMCGGSR